MRRPPHKYSSRSRLAIIRRGRELRCLSLSSEKAASTNATGGTVDASGDWPPAGHQSLIFNAVRQASERRWFAEGDGILAEFWAAPAILGAGNCRSSTAAASGSSCRSTEGTDDEIRSNAQRLTKSLRQTRAINRPRMSAALTRSDGILAPSKSELKADPAL